MLQVGTAGLELLRDIWWPTLFEIGKREGLTAFVERSQSGRRDEGLDPVNRLLKGSLAGPLTVIERNAKLTVDLLRGQKTGFFLDQREHRLQLGRVSQGKRVLNAFGYTGGFSVHAGLGGAAEVATLDISAPALDQAERDWAANGLDPAAHLRLEGDAFELMRQLEPLAWDRVIVDPPAFAKQRKDVDKAFKAQGMDIVFKDTQAYKKFCDIQARRSMVLKMHSGQVNSFLRFLQIPTDEGTSPANATRSQAQIPVVRGQGKGKR